MFDTNVLAVQCMPYAYHPSKESHMMLIAAAQAAGYKALLPHLACNWPMVYHCTVYLTKTSFAYFSYNMKASSGSCYVCRIDIMDLLSHGASKSLLSLSQV